MANDNYVPKVGDEVYVSNSRIAYTVIGRSSENSVVVESIKGGEFRAYREQDLKPLPTEEDKMVDEALELFSALDNPCLETIKTMVQAGYRKVEPISFKDYAKLVSDNSFSQELMFKALADNKHIIVKEGE